MKAAIALSIFVLAGCAGGGSGGSSGGSEHVVHTLGFVELGQPRNEVVTDVTGDGQTTVGYFSTGSGTQASVTWRGDSPTPTGFTISVSGAAYLQAVTPDGKHLLGQIEGLLGRPTVFTKTGSATILPLITGKTAGYPIDLSDDGKVVVCLDEPPSTPFHPRPYLVKDGVATYLPLPTGVTTATASAISGNGHVVVGTIGDQAAIWVDGGEPELIAAPQSGARDVSRNGLAVVGVQRDGSTTHAFRWTAAEGAVNLPPSPTYPNNAVSEAISADGRTVLIASDGAGVQSAPQLWNITAGTSTVADLITAAGGDGAGFDGTMPIRLSADGHVIIGRAKTGGISRPWKLTLP